MRLRYLLLVFFICTKVSYGQERNDFERRYNDVYSDIIASNVGEATRITDSLLAHAQNDEQRIKALMLLANIKHSVGDISVALRHVMKAQVIAELDGFVEWEARTSGFLATTFRNVGLLSESKKNLFKAEVANERQKGSPRYALTRINILQERAFHEMEAGKFPRAVAVLESAKEFIEADTTLSSRAILVKATNDQLLAVCEMEIGDLDKADSLLGLSYQALKGQESNLIPYIYRAQAEIALRRGDRGRALELLDLAAPYIKSSEREELKVLLYESYAKAYAGTDDTKSGHYRDLGQKITAQQTALTRSIATDLLDDAHNQRRKDQQRNYVLWGAIFFLALVCVVLLLRMLTGKVNKKGSDRIEIKPLLSTMDHSVVPFSEESGPHIAEETEKRLLAALERAEAERFYLDPNMSLSKAAMRLETNQRYVSYMLKTYRKKDFNGYLQSSRINYICEQLKEDLSLLDCKISYVASLCGFASHSKFSIAFKAETGILPSTYIQQLRKKNS